jgi:hypothetical protein
MYTYIYIYIYICTTFVHGGHGLSDGRLFNDEKVRQKGGVFWVRKEPKEGKGIDIKEGRGKGCGEKGRKRGRLQKDGR